jgi:hypothetical protein
VDDQKLNDLFQAAVRDVPPASFDELDVAKESRRVTQRRRSLLAGGSALTIVVLAVGVLVTTGGFGQTPGGTSASAGAALVAPAQSNTERSFGSEQLPQAHPAASAPESGFPATTPMQGGADAGSAGSNAGGTPGGCGPTDRELAVALANELPSVGAKSFVADNAIMGTLTCPTGSRSAAYRVQDGSAEGDVIVVLAPAGSQAGEFGARAGSVSASAPASGGRMLTVVIQPRSTSPSAPLGARVGDLAVTVAARL